MLSMAPGWDLEVARGPDWLIVKLHCLPENLWDAPPLADTLWTLLEQHFTYRLVLECHNLPLLHTMLIGQLLMLQRKITANGGMLRLCGLSAANRNVIKTCRLDTRLPYFETRVAAVLGQQPIKPR
ncbi:MAG TPA: STAS domain-containing protein [Pirellulales bacterium]|nr:STAS domain-containing protein [Pirellulales bacterium]